MLQSVQRESDVLLDAGKPLEKTKGKETLKLS